MSRAAAALRVLLLSLAGAFGLEGAFLFAGTLLLAVGASLVSPVAPWFVLGGMCLIVGLALAVPRRTS